MTRQNQNLKTENQKLRDAAALDTVKEVMAELQPDRYVAEHRGFGKWAIRDNETGDIVARPPGKWLTTKEASVTAENMSAAL